jgi:transcriptional regulator with PAS, ATPase and Fis domain
MRTLRDEVSRVLENERPVLLLGETGTGKSMLARYIHDHGARRGHAFVDLNCATFSKELLDSEMFGYERGAFTGAHGSKVGLVEAANGGTLFLDEIGDMDPTIQPKLLKVLEDRRIRRLGDVRDREVDVRLISATHQSLETAVHNRTFRSDLYFRISAYPIYVPPLRARREDIRILASDLLGVLAGDLGRPPPRLTTHAVDALERHTWPGNVRELRNVLDRALLRAGDVVDVQALTFDRLREERGVQESGPPRTLREHEAVLIETALREEGGRVEAAARRLGMARSSLYQKLKVLGLGRTRR